MEQYMRPKGDLEAISNNAAALGAQEAEIELEINRSLPPIRFVEAKQHNPYYLLVELHQQALAANTGSDTTPRPHLAELARSTAVVHWWSRWQPISMHRAFEAGAHIADVAAAAGLTAVETYDRWLTWAEAQSRLLVGGQPCVKPEVVAEISERLRQQMQPFGEA